MSGSLPPPAAGESSPDWAAFHEAYVAYELLEARTNAIIDRNVRWAGTELPGVGREARKHAARAVRG